MINSQGYSVVIRAVHIDEERLIEARVRELPDVVVYGADVEEAHALACDAIDTTAAMFSEAGRQMPHAFSVIDSSGRITLRLPKRLHSYLVELAADDSVSLNQHIVNMLMVSYGYEHGLKAEPEHWKSSTKNERRGALKPIKVFNKQEKPDFGNLTVINGGRA
jgi:predicted HicB family RNase H-like nuclease